MTMPRRYRRSSWLLGLTVLLALGVAVAGMLRDHRRVDLRAALAPSSAPPAAVEAAEAAPLVTAPVGVPMAELVQGAVLRPDGRPAAGATVTFHRVATGWPEWRLERLDQAITRADGRFQFRGSGRHGHVLQFEHVEFAGGLVDAPRDGQELSLRLEPGFPLFGQVLNDVGAPVPYARVAVESVPGDVRRAEAVQAGADGRFRFTNLRAGPVRLVARHDSWQPVAAPAVVVGDQQRVDLRFERPTMTPLRGRVVSATSLEPVGAAEVLLLPLNQRLGLVDPIRTVTAADGTFVLGGLPRGRMRLIVRHSRHGAFQRPQRIDAVGSELTIELPPRSSVEGQVSAERFDDVVTGGERLEIQDAAGEVALATLGADGRFRFAEPLSPGWAELRVLDHRFAFQRTLASAMQVRIEEAAITWLEPTATPSPTVRGRFVDENGRPLAGVVAVRTRLFAEAARTIGGAAWQLDLNLVGNQVADLVDSDRDELLAVSAADGTFTIRGQRPGPLLVRASSTGFGSPLLRLVVPMPGAPYDHGDVVLPRGCRIEGRVLRGRSALAGASVIATAINGDAQGVAVTDRNGLFALDDLMPGNYRLRARLPAQPLGSQERTVEAAPDRTPHEVLVLEAGRTVRGRVTSSDGQPLAGALVGVRGTAGQITATDSNGEFVLELPLANAELLVSLGDRSRQRVVAVPTTSANVEVQLDTPPTCTLLASVAGLPGRKRLSSALLRLVPLDGGDGVDARTRWVELPDGELRWPLCPSGRVRIEIWCDGYVPFVTERDLAANEEHRLGEVLLERGARLAGVVRDPDGAVVPNAEVLLGEETDLDLFEPAVRSDSNGAFVLHGVSGRSAQLVVRASGYAARVLPLSLPNDVLSATPLEVVLERGATIEVEVAAAAAEAGFVQLRRNGRLLASAELDDRGRAWFPNRSAGSYTLQLFGSDAAQVTVTVPKDAALVRARLP